METARLPLVRLLCLTGIVLPACVAPSDMYRTQSERLARVPHDATPAAARRILGTPGEPVFLFRAGGDDYVCRRWKAQDRRLWTELLWRGDELIGYVSDDSASRTETPATCVVPHSVIPLDSGLCERLERFRRLQLGMRVMRPIGQGEVDWTKRERAEARMWWPVAVIFFPGVLPDVLSDRAIYSRFIYLRLGVSAEKLREHAGEPAEVLVGEDGRETWIYRPFGSRGDPTYGEFAITVGLLRGHVSWIRYYHDAARGASN
jgi:hypothetical protein